MAGAKRPAVISERGDWYDHPRWYDILHTPGTAAEVTGLERIAMRHVRTRGRRGKPIRVLEPACGSGRYLRVLAGRGYEVAGFDAKAGMIEYARRRLSRVEARARLFVATLERFSLRPRADLAFSTFSTVRHLLTDDDMLAHLECMGRALAPGGVYVVGIDLARPGVDRICEDVWTGSRSRCTVTQMVQYLPPEGRSRRERVISHLRVDTPGGSRHLDTTYSLRTYTRRQWEMLVGRSPLCIAGECDAYGDELAESGPSDEPGGYRMFVLARRHRRERERAKGSGASGRSTK